MKRRRFTEEQIIQILWQAEVCVRVVQAVAFSRMTSLDLQLFKLGMIQLVSALKPLI